MFDEILACVDGSPGAEEILPIARGLAREMKARLAALSVVVDSDERATLESHLRERVRPYGAELRFLVAADPAEAIIAELDRNRGAIAAMTTHGRTSWAEALMGSVALRVVQNANRPVLLYRSLSGHQEAPKRIRTIAAALDGSSFSEKIIPVAAQWAKAVHGRLLLIQVLPAEFSKFTAPNAPPGDLLESSYLHAKSGEIKKEHGIEPSWDVLHGEPGEAICRYVTGMPETLLAMTSHARSGIKRAIFGSIAAACIRNSGVPLLLYWPHE